LLFVAAGTEFLAVWAAQTEQALAVSALAGAAAWLAGLVCGLEWNPHFGYGSAC